MIYQKQEQQQSGETFKLNYFSDEEERGRQWMVVLGALDDELLVAQEDTISNSWFESKIYWI